MKKLSLNLKFNFRKVKWRDFAKERYLLLTKRFPVVKEERTQVYVMLTLTFIAMSILGLFAISPTISTIVELNRKLDDSKFLFQALETKKTNLSSLHAQYDELQSAWPAVNAAVPDTPQAAHVIAQTQQIAKQHSLRIRSVQTFPVELTKRNNLPTNQASFVFTVSVEGPIEQQEAFLQDLQQFDRIVRIESITYANDEKQVMTVRIRTYFTP